MSYYDRDGKQFAGLFRAATMLFVLASATQPKPHHLLPDEGRRARGRRTSVEV